MNPNKVYLPKKDRLRIIYCSAATLFGSITQPWKDLNYCITIYSSINTITVLKAWSSAFLCRLSVVACFFSAFWMTDWFQKLDLLQLRTFPKSHYVMKSRYRPSARSSPAFKTFGLRRYNTLMHLCSDINQIWTSCRGLFLHVRPFPPPTPSCFTPLHLMYS